MSETNISRIIITPGEPAGIGPDILIHAMQLAFPCELIAVADPLLLAERAKLLDLPFSFQLTDLTESASTHLPGCIKMLPVTLQAPVIPGELNVKNAPYVMETLRQAANICLNDNSNALVTGPVHKAIMNEAGIPFTGHTEFLAQMAHSPETVMLFVVDQLKVALVTTHLPLKSVPQAITYEKVEMILLLLQQALINQFHISSPRIGVCGLNPHAGEGGYLGREEIDILNPLITKCRQNNWKIEGPLPADTIFTQAKLAQFDAILAMYHDQALPVVKYLGFGQAVNVTLGLPFIRTSVDHGTALELAGTKHAHPGSLIKAIELAGHLLQVNHSGMIDRFR